MSWRALLLLLFLVAALPPCKGALSSEEEKLVGQWRHTGKEGEVAQHVFRANGTDAAELRRAAHWSVSLKVFGDWMETRLCTCR